MGILSILRPGRRFERRLSDSTVFTEAVTDAYNQCLELALHSHSGLLKYQIPEACEILHETLVNNTLLILHSTATANLKNDPLAHKSLPGPPSRYLIDKTLTLLKLDTESEISLDQFREFCIVLYRDMFVSECRSDAVSSFVCATVVLFLAKRFRVTVPFLTCQSPLSVISCVGGAAVSSFYICCNFR